MKHRALSGLVVVLLWLYASAATAALVGYPGGDICASAAQAAYNSGYSTGSNEALTACQNNPESCGITLGSLLGAPIFGEIEPNDNMVSANPIFALGTPFWGQSSSPIDQDWFYLVTGEPNQHLTINFAVPRPIGAAQHGRTDLRGWKVSIRDARGTRLSGFDTNFAGEIEDPGAGIRYDFMLGLAGTYYLVVEPSSREDWSALPYNLTAFVQDTPLDINPFVVGFYDAEVEPNDWPSQANPIANGVTMYGLINLTFEGVAVMGESFVWGQGEDDWFRYTSHGNEIITFGFCVREPCSAGNWFVEVYDEASAFALEGGAPEAAVRPLLAINTDTARTNVGDDPETYRFGLMEPGTYYMRVNHKRKFEAPCTGFAQDRNNDGLVDLVDGELVRCGCDSGYSCTIKIPNPQTGPNRACPDGSGGEKPAESEGGNPTPPVEQCDVTCRCVSWGLLVEVPEGEVTSQYNFTWFGTSLPPFTVDSPAYQDFLNRPNPLAP
ncbi:hypothetical protein ABC977_03905 [Thioalkalicoccus limnaeus]|uniref:SD-repeat containing protein B domain-containing protein n=1 Tax=Thioalkalicoccus limnaeus TaxID=120681 RepID=A0ABV4BBQ0_9GAMM